MCCKRVHGSGSVWEWDGCGIDVRGYGDRVILGRDMVMWCA